MKDHIAIMIGIVLGIICLIAISDAYSLEQQAIFTPSGGGGIPPWQFGLILIMPGVVAVTLTIVWMRYQRVFAQDERKTYTKREWFKLTLYAGAVFGVISQAGLQGVINYLTGMPIMWELLGLAVLITGIASAGAYEVIRWRLAIKIKKGDTDLIPAYNWISAKPEEKDPDTGDDMGHLTRFMQPEDPTERKQ